MAVINDLLDQAVARIDVRTAWGPLISIPEPFHKPGTAPVATATPATATPVGFDVARFMQPEISVFLRGDEENPYVVQPYGDPGISKWPIVVAGLGLTIGWLAWLSSRKCKR